MILRDDTQSPKFHRLGFLRRNRWLYGPAAQALYFFILVVIAVIMAIISQFTVGNGGCGSNTAFIITVIEGVVGLVLLALFVFLLWRVEEIYLIKTELGVVLGTGLPALILWAMANALGWSNGYGEALYSEILEVLTICVTIWLPIIGSFHFEKTMTRKRLEHQEEGRSMTSSERNEDEFRYVLMEETTLLPHFERLDLSCCSSPRPLPLNSCCFVRLDSC